MLFFPQDCIEDGVAGTIILLNQYNNLGEIVGQLLDLHPVSAHKFHKPQSKINI